MEWATVIISRGNLESEQPLPAGGDASLESPTHLFVCLFKRSLKSGSPSEISQYFDVDNKLTF